MVEKMKISHHEEYINPHLFFLLPSSTAKVFAIFNLGR